MHGRIEQQEPHYFVCSTRLQMRQKSGQVNADLESLSLALKDNINQKKAAKS